MPQAESVAVGSGRVVGPRHGTRRPAENIVVGRRVDVSSEGGGLVFASASDPVAEIGFVLGDLWFNTITGAVFRLDA